MLWMRFYQNPEGSGYLAWIEDEIGKCVGFVTLQMGIVRLLPDGTAAAARLEVAATGEPPTWYLEDGP